VAYGFLSQTFATAISNGSANRWFDFRWNMRLNKKCPHGYRQILAPGLSLRRPSMDRRGLTAFSVKQSLTQRVLVVQT
jgi:hypothetical protein